jgi:uncharacterized membrane protein YraQ (UPF0718 family)
MMTDCCSRKEEKHVPACCAEERDHKHDHGGFDWIMWGSAFLIFIPYLMMFLTPSVVSTHEWLETYIHGVHEFILNTWWGVLLGIFFLALLSGIPREFVMAALGRKGGAGGIGRAMAAGILLDLCSHGILMVGAKLYERGATLGQVMAFLIASPWNSISLTFILIAMIGLKLTVVFLVLSAVIAFISGLVFDYLVQKKILPDNPNRFTLPEDFRFWNEAKSQLKQVQWTPSLFKSMLRAGIKDSAIVVRWLLAGIVIASVIRVFLDPAAFQQYFGPTLLGMAATVFFATIMEVCSEGSSPIAADLVTRADAPGNAFAFLMAGVSTDYTEIMVLKDTTKSWKIALFLPLVTLPQIILLGILLNMSS